MALPRFQGNQEGEMISPLDELKELLKRTSRVESALNKGVDTLTSKNDFGSIRPTGATRCRAGAYAYSPQAQRATPQADQEWAYATYDDERTPCPLSERRRHPEQAENRQAPICTAAKSKKATHGTVDANARLAHYKCIPRTPLALSIAKMRDAEEQWLKEKAQLRRDADAQRKRASGLEHRYNQLQASYKHQGNEVKALKVALRQRDLSVDQLEVKLRQAQEDAASSEECAHEQLNALRDERRELQRLLNAALAQLQDPKLPPSHGSDGNQEAELGDTNERVTEAMGAEMASADAQHKMDWQAKLMDRLLEVQLAHNRERADAIEQTLCGTVQTAVGEEEAGSEIL